MCQVFVLLFSFTLSAALRRCGIYYSSGCVRCLWNLLFDWKLVFAVVLPAIGICRLNKTFFSWFANREIGLQPYHSFFFSTSRFRLVLPSLLLVISNHESTVDSIPFVRISFMCIAEFHNLHLFHLVYPIWCLVCWCWFFFHWTQSTLKIHENRSKIIVSTFCMVFETFRNLYLCVYKV